MVLFPCVYTLVIYAALRTPLISAAAPSFYCCSLIVSVSAATPHYCVNQLVHDHTHHTVQCTASTQVAYVTSLVPPPNIPLPTSVTHTHTHTHTHAHTHTYTHTHSHTHTHTHREREREKSYCNDGIVVQFIVNFNPMISKATCMAATVSATPALQPLIL